MELGRRVLTEIVPIDIKNLGERYLPSPLFGHIMGPIGRFEFLDEVRIVVFQHHPQGVEHRHDTGCLVVQIVSNAVFQKPYINRAVGLRHANSVAKVPDRRGSVPSPSQSRERGHPWIIPTINQALVHQLLEFALRQDGVVDFQSGKLGLPWLGLRHLEVIQDPVVEFPVVFELQRTQRVG